MKLPSVSFDLNLIPDIRLGDIPGFDLPELRLNLKGLLKYKDLFPDISLRRLVMALAIKFPDLDVRYILFELGRIFDLDFPRLFPQLSVWFPPELRFELPSLAFPDINMPRVLPPNFDLGLDVDLRAIRIPGLDLPRLLRMPGFDRILRLLHELFDVADLGDIIGLIGIESFTSFVTSALPIVQQLKSGASALKECGEAAQDLYKSYKTREHQKFVLPGDARAACGAVRTLLRESSGEHAVRGAIDTAQFGASLAGLFADLGAGTGPAVAAGASVSKLIQRIVIVAAKHKERKKVNFILQTRPADALSAHLFDVSPLLGCYFLVNSTTSNVLNVLSEDILLDAWMADAERNKREHLDPLIRDARTFIDRSHYVLFPIRQNKGMYVERSTMEKLKLGAALYMKKKLGRAPASATVSSHRYIGR